MSVSDIDVTHKPQDFYACVDLITSCFRMNCVALAKDMLDQRDPITSYAEFHQLAIDLLSILTTCRSKYERPRLKDCPDLALAEEVQLEEAAGAADIIVDLRGWPGPPTKQLKTAHRDCQDPAMTEEDQMEETAGADLSDWEEQEVEMVDQEAHQVPEQGEADEYREYQIGLYTKNEITAP